MTRLVQGCPCAIRDAGSIREDSASAASIIDCLQCDSCLKIVSGTASQTFDQIAAEDAKDI